MKVSPLITGIITAVLMIAVIMLLYQFGNKAPFWAQFLVYIIYASGIIWTIYSYRQNLNYTGGFGTLFNQGFKCFVIVTLMMALFYGIFSSLHPEFAEESSEFFKSELEKGNLKTPAEIDSAVRTYKKQYNLKLVSGAIFGYLIIGAGVSALTSALLNRRK